MSNFDGVLNPAAGWPEIPQASTTMVVLGGAGGPLNEQATKLTARTNKLKADIANLAGGFGGQYRNLSVIVSGVGYQGTVAADCIVVEGDDFSSKLIRDVNLSFNGANSGQNGLDNGAMTAGNWYYIHVIHNPTTDTTASLISLSATNPALPAGYTNSTRVGAAYSLSEAFRPSTKTNEYVLWGVGTTMNSVVVLNAASSTTVTPFSLSTAKPPTAKKISIRFVFPTGSTGWGELDIDNARTTPIIYINQTEQAFCADVPVLVPDTLYYITSGESAKVTSTAYGYEDSV